MTNIIVREREKRRNGMVKKDITKVKNNPNIGKRENENTRSICYE